MPGLSELIDRLMTARQTPTARGRAEAEALQGALNERVSTFNARMRRCVAYLDAGLRTEAAHAARLAPALLDTATVFMSPTWAACVTEGMIQPRSDDATLARIRQAIADERQIDSAAAEYRAALLARPPAVARAGLLRTLLAAERDPNVWADERRRVEPVALREATAAFDAAERAGDRAVARRWAAWIDAGVWLTPVPEALRGRVAALLAPLRRERAFASFSIDALRTARATEDLTAIEALLDQWAELITREQAEPPTESVAVVRAVNAWLIATLRRQDVARRRPIGPAMEKTPVAKKKRFWS